MIKTPLFYLNHAYFIKYCLIKYMYQLQYYIYFLRNNIFYFVYMIIKRHCSKSPKPITRRVSNKKTKRLSRYKSRYTVY